MQYNDHVNRWRYWRLKQYQLTPGYAQEIERLKRHAAELGLL